MKKNEYKCAICGNVYKKGWSDEEAKKESKNIWGNIPKEEQEIICDDCFNKKFIERNISKRKAMEWVENIKII